MISVSFDEHFEWCRLFGANFPKRVKDRVFEKLRGACSVLGVEHKQLFEYLDKGWVYFGKLLADFVFSAEIFL